MELIHKRIEEVVADLSRRYLSFTQAIELSLSTALFQSDLPGNPLPYLFENRLNSIVYQYQFDIEQQLSQRFDEIVRESLPERASGVIYASLSTQQQDALSSYWGAQKQAMISALGQQIRRAKERAAIEYRNYQLKVSMAVALGKDTSTTLTAERHRIMQSEVGQYRDAGGRRWKGLRYVESALRESLYGTLNTTVVFLLTLNGEYKGQIYRPGHGMDGAIFELDLFESHRAEDFHPNARALVAKVSHI